jgi:hypothetical protein
MFAPSHLDLNACDLEHTARPEPLDEMLSFVSATPKDH